MTSGIKLWFHRTISWGFYLSFARKRKRSIELILVSYITIYYWYAWFFWVMVASTWKPRLHFHESWWSRRQIGHCVCFMVPFALLQMAEGLLSHSCMYSSFFYLGWGSLLLLLLLWTLTSWTNSKCTIITKWLRRIFRMGMMWLHVCVCLLLLNYEH